MWPSKTKPIINVQQFQYGNGKTRDEMISRLYKDLDQNALSLSDLSDKGYSPGMKDEAIQTFLDETLGSKGDKEVTDNENYGSDNESHVSE